LPQTTNFSKFTFATIRPFLVILHQFFKIILGSTHAAEAKRRLKTLRFTSKFVPDNKLHLSQYGGLSSYNREIARIVIGSDQVWNYNFCSLEDLKLRLGNFAPGDKLISYAASIGVSDIDEKYLPVFRESLNRLSAISVREFRAKELVEAVSDQKATVVLDPTLMLSQTDWIAITNHFVPEEERYVLTYFLAQPSANQEKTISEYASNHHLRIRRILDSRDLETSTAGPQDFVELFSKADFIFTDSYHACCFSIIFAKDFKVFTRTDTNKKTNMNSRMQTLFRLFEIEDSMGNDNQILPLDHEKISALLNKHQIESRRWLEQALEL
jgi:hypothetical protein